MKMVNALHLGGGKAMNEIKPYSFEKSEVVVPSAELFTADSEGSVVLSASRESDLKIRKSDSNKQSYRALKPLRKFATNQEAKTKIEI